MFRLSGLDMITITGVIYALVLAQLWAPTGWQKIVDETLHYSVPIFAVGGFLLFGPRPLFSRDTLWRSLIIPVAWVAYRLIRSPFISYTQGGETRHWYPYHFINVDDIGYGQVLLNMAVIFLFLLALSWLYTYLDRKLPARPAD